MEEGCDLAVAVGDEHAVLGAFIHPRLHGEGHRIHRKVELQRVEHDHRITRRDKRSALHALRNPGHGDHDVVENGRSAAVYAFMGGWREKLALGRVLGNTLAVPTRMEKKHLLGREAIHADTECNFDESGERRPTRAHSPTVPVGHNEILGFLRKQPFLQARVDLDTVCCRLPLVRRGNDHPIPTPISLGTKGGTIVVPSVVERLRKEAILH